MPIDEDVSSATENLIETSWSMYPNPCQSNLNIQSQNNHTKTLQIYALNGQLLQYYEMTKEIKIDLEDLQAGVYMVLIQEDKHVFSRKLFKQ
jgi:myo-inositol-hexaphosphate 3-phosphohydrolase